MTLLSPLEDFKTRTLSAIEGNLARLRYLAGLRDPAAQRYRHWGMERLHGPAAAQEAIGTAHYEIFLEVLRTPIRLLADEFERQSMETGEEIRPAGLSLLMMPEGVAAASERHFNSVLLALSGLENAKRHSNQQSASRRRPPVR